MATVEATSIDKSNGPEPEFISDLMGFVSSWGDQTGYIKDEILTFSGLEDRDGLTLIEARTEQMPEYDERDEDVYEDFDAQFKLTIHADANLYKGDAASKVALLSKVKKWLSTERNNYLKILSTDVVRSEAAFHEVCSVILVDSYVLSGLIGDIKDSPFYHDVWNKHMNKLIQEGVCYMKGKVPDDLRKKLQEHINEVAQKTPVDYHPKSNDIVRDLVHPALYPYIKGVSKVKKDAKLPDEIEKREGSDFWGRPYEDSKFQWLPAPFKITDERKCLIQEYINNLDCSRFPNLYNDLKALFEIFLPYFEEVWSYARAMEFFEGDDRPTEEKDVKPFKKEEVSFAGKELQVITKIVDYTLKPGQSYEGVWHAEGMSHENIVMTGRC